METCCGYGYGLARELHRLRGIFKGRRRRTGHRKSRGALREPRVPISGQADSRERVPYQEKRTLPGVCADVSHFVCVTAHGPKGPFSVSRFGNINPIPFRSNESTIVRFYKSSTVLRFRTEFSYLLGPTDPCSTAVHMEPFSTSVFKVLV